MGFDCDRKLGEPLNKVRSITSAEFFLWRGLCLRDAYQCLSKLLAILVGFIARLYRCMVDCRHSQVNQVTHSHKIEETYILKKLILNVPTNRPYASLYKFVTKLAPRPIQSICWDVRLLSVPSPSATGIE